MAEDDRGRSAERLVTFADAVVAIAVTLLALPLADLPAETATKGLGEVLEDGAPLLLAFGISFFVIARLWWAHHRIFEHVVRWDRWLVRLTIVWLFTVVLLAPVTALTGTRNPYGDEDPYANAGAVAIYIGTMTASSLLLTALARHVRLHPEVTDGHDVEAERRWFASVETSLGFALALVIGTAVPWVNYFALLLLVVTGRVGDAVWRRRHPVR
jgi:uncharacterized membrane protein